MLAPVRVKTEGAAADEEDRASSPDLDEPIGAAARTSAAAETPGEDLGAAPSSDQGPSPKKPAAGQPAESDAARLKAAVMAAAMAASTLATAGSTQKLRSAAATCPFCFADVVDPNPTPCCGTSFCLGCLARLAWERVDYCPVCGGPSLLGHRVAEDGVDVLAHVAGSGLYPRPVVAVAVAEPPGGWNTGADISRAGKASTARRGRGATSSAAARAVGGRGAGAGASASSADANANAARTGRAQRAAAPRRGRWIENGSDAEGSERDGDGEGDDDGDGDEAATNVHVGVFQNVCTFDPSICRKTFAKPSALRRHIRTHTGDKPFECSYPRCGQAFAERGNLKRHTKVHSGDRPFQCEYPGCKLHFARRGHMTQHMQTQHPVKATRAGAF